MHHFKYKTKGLVSHAIPEGKAIMGEREVLHKKFINGNITKEELRKYVNFLMLEKNFKPAKTTVTVTIWGKKIVLTTEEYKKRFSSLSICIGD